MTKNINEIKKIQPLYVLNSTKEKELENLQEEYHFKYYNSLKHDIVSLKKFVKFSQIQYNYFRIHRHLNINKRLFPHMEFFLLSKTTKCF